RRSSSRRAGRTSTVRGRGSAACWRCSHEPKRRAARHRRTRRRSAAAVRHRRRAHRLDLARCRRRAVRRRAARDRARAPGRGPARRRGHLVASRAPHPVVRRSLRGRVRGADLVAAVVRRGAGRADRGRRDRRPRPPAHGRRARERDLPPRRRARALGRSARGLSRRARGQDHRRCRSHLDGAGPRGTRAPAARRCADARLALRRRQREPAPHHLRPEPRVGARLEAARSPARAACAQAGPPGGAHRRRRPHARSRGAPAARRGDPRARAGSAGRAAGSAHAGGAALTILALDIGTSSVRAQRFDDAAEPTDELRQERYDTNDAAEVAKLVRDVLGGEEPDATSCFAHSLVVVDGDFEPLTPILGWRDTRSATAAEWLCRRLDRDAVHARTGAYLHPSFWPAKLAWLAETDPETFRRAAHFVSFSDFARGAPETSLSMASSSGLLDLTTNDWDEELLATLGLDAERLPRI